MGGTISSDWKERLEQGGRRMPCDEFRNTDLHEAAKDGPPPQWLVKCIQRQIPETVNAVDVHGYSVLHTAALKRNPEFVRMLLRHPKLRVNEYYQCPFSSGKVEDIVKKDVPRVYSEFKRHPNYGKALKTVACTPEERLVMHNFLGNLMESNGTGAKKAAGKKVKAGLKPKNCMKAVARQRSKPKVKAVRKQKTGPAKKGVSLRKVRTTTQKKSN